ncbi:MAG: D-isomer specific 2-hydroxyacid dehydrogenase NAD-binding protein [Candidatus Woesebacteria bacterium GW2011_GWB1_38_5]|uniref:D-isomer specific 2-hydroxyacid dehydrogenase NAD-binding protein n=2 Tax=Candidatus Woeseibacteriota TaxID=1752722 RepID=A0A0G0K6N8_9BACT|nr:MAG: D-isomer specific 2-hydroxyacid dehydrogenase NAD-binding protein [Candidatus Woesebacteria bacterium GW2011_GWB1_38_5]
MAKIFVSRKFPGTHLDRLQNSGNEVYICEHDRPLSAEEFLERAKGMDAVLSFLTDKIDGEVVDAVGPQMKIFSNYAVGFDNINVPQVSEKNVLIANTPCDEVNEAVAEHAVTLMLSLARRLVEADESTKRGSYRGWEPNIFLGHALRGKTLGIVGLGRIGTMAAKKVKGFDMRVLYNKRSPDPEAEKEFGIEFADLDRLYRESDFISVHVPLTDETRGMIGRDAIGKMKHGVIIVNTARGPIVDEHALVDGLREGKVGGAGLDVFETEPNINPELIGMENVILTPHIASATWEAREKMGQLAVDAILKTLSGEIPENLVNPETWDQRRK